MSVEPRCLRGDACADVCELRDEAGAWIANMGALLGPHDACGLCRVCNARARHATRYLLLDWLDMGVLMKPTGEIRFRDPDVPTAPRVKLHSPMPLRAAPLDWQILAHHEATCIADTIALALDQPQPFASAKMHARFSQAATFIHDHWDALLVLGPTEQRARSEGYDETEGNDLDDVRYTDGDVWIVRDGPEMASRLFDLHLSAERKTGVAAVDVLPVPCPACARPRTLVRDHRANSVHCRNKRCAHYMSDDAYDELRTMTPDSFTALSAQLAAQEVA